MHCTFSWEYSAHGLCVGSRETSQLVGPRQAPSPLVLVTSTRAHGDHNATLCHKRSMSMIPTHAEQAHNSPPHLSSWLARGQPRDQSTILSDGGRLRLRAHW